MTPENEDHGRMKIIESTANQFGGVIPDPNDLDVDPTTFAGRLETAMSAWNREGYRVAWREIPIAKSQLVPLAVEKGFSYHHCGDEYLMLTRRLDGEAFIPAHASHYIGAGGVVINERQELLVVSELYHRKDGAPPRYKLPGGALHEGEHLQEAVVREVEEETGIKTQFDALVCFRHWHGYRFGKSDIYFVCRLQPVSEEITIQHDEIAESRWMPVQEYLGAESVSSFNKCIVEAAIRSPGIVHTDVEGYADGRRFEFFMPKL